MALSLLLLEHMQDKAHAQQLRTEFLRALLAATLASDLCVKATDGEEAFIGGLFQNLGRMLAGFYLPDEARRVRTEVRLVEIDLDAPPADANGVSLADVTLKAGKFIEPVLVDVRTSTVYALPKGSWTQSAAGTVFRALPVYDSPMLIAERAVLGITPAAR